MIKLKEARKAKGLTQKQLADAVRYADPTADQTLISVLERGQLYPSEKLRDALCEALGVTEAELYDGVEAFFVPADETKYSDTTEILADIFTDATGPRKYISRALLRSLYSQKVGAAASDRTVRKAIEKARQEGMIICNAQDGMGYFLPDSEADLERQYKANQSRALAILRQQKYIRRRLNGH